MAQVAGNTEPKKKKKKGLFGRKKDKSTGSSIGDGNEASPKRKKGFGSRIRGLVKGRTKKKKDGDATNSLYTQDYDPNSQAVETVGDVQMKSALEGHKMAPVQEDVSMHSEGDYVHSQKKQNNSSKTAQASNHESIALVILLVDPETLRFELLQLEFDAPQDALVKDVITQISTSVTEPALQHLTFHALVDREGKAHSMNDNTPLHNALSQRRNQKDVLVGLSNGISLEHCSRLARPILGDEKVISMLQTNGYDLTGWEKDKSRGTDFIAKDDTTTETSAKKTSPIVLGIGALVVLYISYMIYLHFTGAQNLNDTLVGDVMENFQSDGSSEEIASEVLENADAAEVAEAASEGVVEGIVDAAASALKDGVGAAAVAAAATVATGNGAAEDAVDDTPEETVDEEVEEVADKAIEEATDAVAEEPVAEEPVTDEAADARAEEAEPTSEA